MKTFLALKKNETTPTIFNQKQFTRLVGFQLLSTLLKHALQKTNPFRKQTPEETVILFNPVINHILENIKSRLLFSLVNKLEQKKRRFQQKMFLNIQDTIVSLLEEKFKIPKRQSE